MEEDKFKLVYWFLVYGEIEENALFLSLQKIYPKITWPQLNRNLKYLLKQKMIRASGEDCCGKWYELVDEGEL